MHSSVCSLLRVCVALSLSATATSAQSLTLIGLDGPAKSLGMRELQALPQVEHSDSGANGVTRYRGPTLRSVVTLAGAPEGRALRGLGMTIVVLAEAADKYKVAYTLAEIDEQFGARTPLVALTQNGQPIAGNEGPMRIVMPGETHRARWIRQLTTLRLLQLGHER
ncbi:MAG: molybdopterin-dependent oxidoreductase [Gemmatimonadota bacterium]